MKRKNRHSKTKNKEIIKIKIATAIYLRISEFNYNCKKDDYNNRIYIDKNKYVIN